MKTMFRKNLSLWGLVFPMLFFGCSTTTYIVNLNGTNPFYVNGRVKTFTEVVYAKVIVNNKSSDSIELARRKHLEFSKDGKILYQEFFTYGNDENIFTYHYGEEGNLNLVVQKVNGKIISKYKITYEGYLKKREEWIDVSYPNSSQATTFHYNENGELIREYYFFLNSLNPISETFYEYNKKGQVSNKIVRYFGRKYEKEEHTFKYDWKGRKIFSQKTEINLKDSSDVNIRKEYIKYKTSGSVKRRVFSKYAKNKSYYYQLAIKNKHGHLVKLQRFGISESEFDTETSENLEAWLLSETEAVYQYEFDKYGNWLKIVTEDPIINPPSGIIRNFIYYE